MLVLVALALIALLVVAGLALDGGVVFLERRRMQNAADAAALAGAQQLAEIMCDSEGAEAADALVYAAVVTYAERNGVRTASDLAATYVKFDGDAIVEFTPPVLVGSGAVPDGASGVAVTPTITRSTALVSLAGIDKTSASAYAMAVTGPPLTGGGLRPFGVPIQLAQTLDPNDPENNWFEIVFKHNGGTIQWAGSEEAEHRGWMNFGYVWKQDEDPTFPRAIDQNASANDLKTWMEEGWDGRLYADCLWDDGCRNGDYIHARPGTNSSAVCKAPEEEPFYIPVYDSTRDCPTEIPDPKPDCPHQGSSYCYHIVGFAAVRILEGTCDGGGGTFEAELVELITGKGTPSPNEGFGSDVCATHTMVVTLWE
jgi:Flp pilus assembly protein TadG